MRMLKGYLQLGLFCLCILSIGSFTFPTAYSLQAPELFPENLFEHHPAARPQITPFDPPNFAPLVAVATDNVAALAFYFQGVIGGAHLIMDSETGATLLHFAAIHSPPAMLDAIVSRGGIPNHPDHDGDTPLHWAARIGDLDVINQLMKLGADADISNVAGLLPWHIAQQELSESDNKVLVLSALYVNDEPTVL